MIECMDNQNFTRTFLGSLAPGHRVLDLGAGEGDFARMFCERGAKVTAVDHTIPQSKDGAIECVRIRVEEFIEGKDRGSYDAVFMRNILQFLQKHWVFATLFPWLGGHLKQGGIIGIETFSRDPEPPFNHPMRSLYTAKELLEHFLLWQDLCVQEYEHDGPDMRGTLRHFFITDLIVRKTG